MTDEENDRPAWGKRDPLEVEAKMDFDADKPILDGSIQEWDGRRYLIEIIVISATHTMIKVTLLAADGSDLDSTSYLSSRSENRHASINQTVFDLMCELGRIWRGHKEHEARREYMGGKCIDLETGRSYGEGGFDDFDARR